MTVPFACRLSCHDGVLGRAEAVGAVVDAVVGELGDGTVSVVAHVEVVTVAEHGEEGVGGRHGVVPEVISASAPLLSRLVGYGEALYGAVEGELTPLCRPGETAPVAVGEGEPIETKTVSM